MKVNNRSIDSEKGYEFNEDEYYLWVLIREVRDVCLRVRQKELDKYGIESQQSAVLIIIKAIGDGATIGEISRWLCREPHTVSSIIGRMEKIGLVSRIKDPNVKSIVHIFFTKKGQQIYDLAIRRESIHKIIPVLSKEQRRNLVQYLQILRDKALEELGASEKPPYPPLMKLS